MGYKRPMESKSSYARRFRRHVAHFMETHALWPKKGAKVVVGLSGGPDSMSLLHVLLSLRGRYFPDSPRPHAFCIDHRFRKGSGEEVEFCRRQCEALGAPFQSVEMGESPSSNREHRWHRLRLDIFGDHLLAGDLLYQGHHLDDSFEWFLLGQLKSSSRQIPGIPLVSGFIRRPFLCVTKAQILRYAREERVPFILDESNGDERFERNYLRRTIASWKRPFPKYLKHYAQRQNDLAQRRSVHVLGQRGDFHRARDGFGGRLFWSWEELGGGGLKEALLRGIGELGRERRGRLSKEVDKLLASAKRGRAQGPMVFSGGVEAYLDRNLIYLLGEEGRRLRGRGRAFLGLRSRVFESELELREFYEKRPRGLALPLFVEAGGRPKGRALGRRHPLFSPFVEEMEMAGFWSTPLRLLRGGVQEGGLRIWHWEERPSGAPRALN
ncbi:MAG: tRNA lysidine(34) synthetase TilS [Bacteriovoracales bacterium]|nr:tRNA lysidine(34) synthetase TilS [Bacteriovoracales bacterium]